MRRFTVDLPVTVRVQYEVQAEGLEPPWSKRDFSKLKLLLLAQDPVLDGDYRDVPSQVSRRFRLFVGKLKPSHVRTEKPKVNILPVKGPR